AGAGRRGGGGRLHDRQCDAIGIGHDADARQRAVVQAQAAQIALLLGRRFPAERWFKLSWEATPEKQGDLRRLRGYVENTYGEAAGRVQLLGQALDASGAVVGQKISWLSGTVGGFGRVYFEIPNMPPADHYRVTVWTYERIQAPGGWVIR